MVHLYKFRLFEYVVQYSNTVISDSDSDYSNIPITILGLYIVPNKSIQKQFTNFLHHGDLVKQILYFIITIINKSHYLKDPPVIWLGLVWFFYKKKIEKKKFETKNFEKKCCGRRRRRRRRHHRHHSWVVGVLLLLVLARIFYQGSQIVIWSLVK